MKFGLSKETINAISNCFANYKSVCQVILYGSRAKGTFRNGSDIDLTIIDDGEGDEILSKLETQLDDLLLPYKIDLSLKRQLKSTDLLDHINRVGQVFYER